MVRDEEVESCPKRARHHPGDHYGRAERALSLYSPGLGAHSGRHLSGFRLCWNPSGTVSDRSPAANGLHVLIIRPSVRSAPLVSPQSPGANEETGPRWVGLLGC